MYLTTEEENVLNGKYGMGKSNAMKLLVSLGEMFDADKLIPIKRAHWAVSGQEGDLFFAEKLANSGARVSVVTTTNPAWDSTLSNLFHVDIDDYERSLLDRTIEVSDKLGVIKSFNCTPYLYKDVPSFGEHAAFSESSATPYINSVYGARTNRESSSSALAAGVIGKTPNYGLHLDENRIPNITVNVSAQIKDDFDMGLLGWHLGEILKPDDVPLIKGLKIEMTEEGLRDFGAMMNTSGAVSLFHLEGVTPEVKVISDTSSWVSSRERITVTSEDVEKVRKKFTDKRGKINSVYIGCPHSTIPEVMKVNRLLDGRKVNDEVKFLIFTSATNIKILGENVKKLASKGVYVMQDSCVDEPVFKFTEGGLGATNSLKAAYYRKRRNQEFVVTNIENLVEAAVRGYI
jgi:predicted aconitase